MGSGRIWKISPDGTNVSEAFRIQPMRNSTAFGGIISGSGVGRQVRDFPPGTLTNTAGGRDQWALGLAFNPAGDLLIADGARGAIWKVKMDPQGNPILQTGCDQTYASNTLCLSHIFVSHPMLEDAAIHSFSLDAAGNMFLNSAQRNSLVAVSPEGNVVEVFRNPENSAVGTGLRSGFGTPAAPDVRDTHILEGPISIAIVGKDLYVSNRETVFGDNAPNTNGETSPTATFKGKVSKMDQQLLIEGLPLQ